MGNNQEAPKKTARKPKPRPKKYLCTQPNCDKAYSRPCLLEQHLRSHADERPFSCDYPGCGKAFLRDSHLKTHMLSHSVEKPLYCSYCGKGFNTNQHLNRHERTHFPSVKCTYEGCTAAFRRNSQLRKHISECHTLRKPFVCPACPREFDIKSRLDAHFAKSHGGTASDTPLGSNMSTPVPGGNPAHQGSLYHCANEGCSERFDSWADLLAHIRVLHKRVVCNLCGKTFESAELLEYHSKEHAIDKTDLISQYWHCREPQCEAAPITVSFREKDGLISHYQQYHGYIPDTLQVQVQTPASAESLPPLSAITDQQRQQRSNQQHQYFPGQQPLPNVSYPLQYPNSFPSSVPQPQQYSNREPAYKGPSIIDRITGAGYDANRRIECPVENCGYRFAREYDMKRHAKAVHPYVDIDELIAASKLHEHSVSPAVPNETSSTFSQYDSAGAPSSMSKFKYYLPSGAQNEGQVLSNPPSQVLYGDKHDDLNVSTAPLDQHHHHQQQQQAQQQYHQPQPQQQQQLPPLPQYGQQSQPQRAQQNHMLPSFDNSSFDYLPHELSLGNFSSVPLPHDIFNDHPASSNTGPSHSLPYSQSHTPQYGQAPQHVHPQSPANQHQG